MAAVFPLVPRRRVIGLAFGGVRSARRGVGSDVASTREYRPGDDVAWMDWAASARLSAARGSDEFIVRERFADEAPRVVVLGDRRPSMAIASSPFRQVDKPRAILTALELIGASAIAARSLTGLPRLRGGRAVLARPAHRVARRAGDVRAELSRAAPTPCRRASSSSASTGATCRRRPSSSSFPTSSSRPTSACGQGALEHRWEIVPVMIQDPVWERSFPEIGGITVPYADPRNGRVYPVYVTEREAARLRDEHEARWDALVGDFRSLGIEPVAVHTHDYGEMLGAFLRWADLRQMWRGAVA